MSTDIAGNRSSTAHRRPTVLFLQSSAFFAADAQVHACIAGGLSEEGVGVIVACERATGDEHVAAIDRFRAAGKIEVVPCCFGPRFDATQGGWRHATALVGSAARTAFDVGTLWWTARRRRVTVVHCTEKAREAMVAYLLAKTLGAALVIHLHVKVDAWWKGPTLWVMHRADRLVAISEFVAESAAASGFAPGRVVVALNAFAPQDDPERSTAEDRTSVRAEFASGNIDVHVLSIVARINPWKGHRDLLQALTLVAEDEPDFLLLVVGEGDDELEGELLRLAADLGIGDRVRFTGFRTDVQRIIRASDVFAMPSFEEPFGLVFLEAMYAGVPVVAVDNGGTPEVVEHDVTGLLSAPGDIATLAANIVVLLRDRARRERMGALGQVRVRERFLPSRLAHDFGQIVYGLESADGSADQEIAK